MKKLLLLTLVFIAFKLHAQQTISMNINGDGKEKISRFIYGQFAEHLGRCVYDGFYLTDTNSNVKRDGRIRLDVVDALKAINIPLLRWPGGCFADRYHWSDGIGPAAKRPQRINITWGGLEDNSFGTDEFLHLCELLHCEPYMAGNVGTGTPQEMSDWIEYLNFDGKSTLADMRRANGHPQPYKVSFWGVGNESWGCGGDMTPEYYSNEYKRYASFCPNFAGAPVKKIMSGANSDDYNWTEVCMKNTNPNMLWGLSVHYYTVVNDWTHKGSATTFGEDEYFRGLKKALFMDKLIAQNASIMDRYDPAKKVSLCVDEWGIWTDPEPNSSVLYQQNSLRDALIAASTLNIFNQHCDRVHMANLAQTVNVLQSLILTEKDKMLLTPTYYVFDMFKYHQDATLLPLSFNSPNYTLGNESIPSINASASKDSNGVVHITLVNLDPKNKISVSTAFNDIKWKDAEGKVLTSKKFTDVNTFDNPSTVKETSFTDFKKNGYALTVNLAPMSVTLITLK